MKRKYYIELPITDEITEYGSVIHWSRIFIRPQKANVNNKIVPITCTCGKERNIAIYDLPHYKYKGLCFRCSAKLYVPRGKKHIEWNGGIHINSAGYRQISKTNLSAIELEIVNPMFQTRNYIPEHRLIVALHLKRPLSINEHVHHVNKNKLDNRIENLQLVSPSEHADVELTWARAEISRLRHILDELGIPY